MDAFISGKKRKALGDLPRQPVSGPLAACGENETTEFKLATLASLYPSLSQDVIMDSLISAGGVVDDAASTLACLGEQYVPAKRTTIGGVADRQSSLLNYKLPRDTLPSPRTSPSGSLTKKGQTLHLYTPEDIALHTPCSILHNFLPPQYAEDLLRELLVEAPTFEKQTFKLFDNVVQSPHSACFYVDSLEEQQRQRTEYLYNGSYLTV